MSTLSLYEAIVAEVAKGYLRGPYTEEMLARFIAELHIRVVEKLGSYWSAHFMHATEKGKRVLIQVDIRQTEKSGVTPHLVTVECLGR